MTANREMVSTGIPGLDDILSGGLTRDRVYLVQGVPGSGKTTMALQFLREGVRRGDTVLYITLSETRAELQAVARSHGWDIGALPICEVVSPEGSLDSDQEYSVFHPAEVELSGATRQILDEIGRLAPSRVVFDSLAELRLLAGSTLRYRRQVLALKQYFIGRGCTVLLLDDQKGADSDVQIDSVVHGVVLLDSVRRAFGTERRVVRVSKYRGVAFSGGTHDFAIRHGGLIVFPRLKVEHSEDAELLPVRATGIAELDTILAGGIECGTSTLIIGAAGTGKSTLGATVALAAAKRRETAAMFLFDESRRVLLSRMRGIGSDFDSHVEDGAIVVEEIDPAELSPGEFSSRVRAAADGGARVVVIDSLNGYLNATPDERFLIAQLHELLMYLGRKEVITILIAVQSGIVGNMSSAVEASYLADSIIMLRYFEADGHVHQAISVVKKRSGAHERTLRELRITTEGVHIGEPLTRFRGVLTGTPTFTGPESALMQAPLA